MSKDNYGSVDDSHAVTRYAIVEWFPADHPGLRYGWSVVTRLMSTPERARERLAEVRAEHPDKPALYFRAAVIIRTYEIKELEEWPAGLPST
jgi:predicted Zn-dependent protease